MATAAGIQMRAAQKAMEDVQGKRYDTIYPWVVWGGPPVSVVPIGIAAWIREGVTGRLLATTHRGRVFGA
jgi:hypothetical protein